MRGFQRQFVFCIVAAACAGCGQGSSSTTEPTASTEPAAATPVASTSDESHEPATAVHTLPPKSTDEKHTQKTWLAEMGGDAIDARVAASERIEALGGDKAVALYFAHLQDSNLAVRRGAYFGLYGKFNPDDEKMQAAFRAALGDDDRAIRHIGLEAMNRLPLEEFVAGIPQLVVLLQPDREDAPLRARVVRMLNQRGKAAKAALPTLKETIENDPDFNVRTAALQAAYNVAPRQSDALPALQAALVHDADPRLRRIAAQRIGTLGRNASPALGDLIAALGDQGIPDRADDDPLKGKDEPVCTAASAALVKIGAPAVDALAEGLESGDELIKVMSIETLGRIGPAAQKTLPKLKELAQSPDGRISTPAKAALVLLKAN